jgi:hypothetical protein
MGGGAAVASAMINSEQAPGFRPGLLRKNYFG